MASESPSSTIPFSPGSFGRFQLLERLAVGGMAEIFRAKQTGVHGFEKVLVIKRILPHLAADPEFLAMFIDEAKLQCALSHPKIVQVFEFGEVDGQYFIALEYIDGMDALGLLRACAHRRQRLPVRLAVHIVCEILDALDYAHSMQSSDGRSLGVVHRDVSPSNVFIAHRGDVKLGDFGIARAAEPSRHSKTQAGTLKGKYGYMAPEQVIGSDVDGRADLFAVGIVLAEMLMGRRLFTAPNDLDVLLMVRDAKLERLERYGSDIPHPLKMLLIKMLARNPQARFQTAGLTREALMEFLFEARERVGPQDLGAFLQTLREDAAPAMPKVTPSEVNLMMVGEDTRARLEAAEQKRQEVLRASQEPSMQRLLEGGVRVEAPPDEGESLIIIDDSDDPHLFADSQSEANLTARFESAATPVEDAAHPDLKGDFSDSSPARLFGRLAMDRDTGQLIVEHQNIKKEIFLVDGVPEYVSSNLPSERFGEYLVSKGVISPGELSMALAVLPRFHGKLGDTLVGLGLLRPLEVFRHLTRQVREKIIDVFSWRTGTFRYYRGKVNPRESFPLGLDAFEILGAGVAGLPMEVLRYRLDPISHLRVRRAERSKPVPEQFRVGAGPRELWQRLDGKRTVGDWIRRYNEPDQLITLCRTLYLLLETDLAIID